MRPPPRRIRKEKHKSGEGGFRSGRRAARQSLGLVSAGSREAVTTHTLVQASPLFLLPHLQSWRGKRGWKRGKRFFYVAAAWGKFRSLAATAGKKKGDGEKKMRRCPSPPHPHFPVILCPPPSSSSSPRTNTLCEEHQKGEK